MFYPIREGIQFFPGDTVLISLRLCDSPDICSSNCEVFQWKFLIMPLYGCDRFPNPFTPNADNIHDFVYFRFPNMGYNEGKIYLYDVHNVLVNTINVPSGGNAVIKAVWDGTDMDGNLVPAGVYLYVIEVDGEIVCTGTVTVAY